LAKIGLAQLLVYLLLYATVACSDLDRSILLSCGERVIMALPITSIAKLLLQLATLTPAVNSSVEKIRELIETVRKPGAGTQNRLDDLQKAIELQAAVNKEMNDKLKLIETVLQTVQKSLKTMVIAGAIVGFIAVAALVVAIVK
jgi:predicted PurR-regulated permease PerM